MYTHFPYTLLCRSCRDSRLVVSVERQPADPFRQAAGPITARHRDAGKYVAVGAFGHADHLPRRLLGRDHHPMAFHGEEMLELIDGHGSNHGLANEGPVLEGGNAFVHHRIAAPVELASDAVDRLVAIVRPVPADAEIGRAHV